MATSPAGALLHDDVVAAGRAAGLQPGVARAQRRVAGEGQLGDRREDPDPVVGAGSVGGRTNVVSERLVQFANRGISSVVRPSRVEDDRDGVAAVGRGREDVDLSERACHRPSVPSTARRQPAGARFALLDQPVDPGGVLLEELPVVGQEAQDDQPFLRGVALGECPALFDEGVERRGDDLADAGRDLDHHAPAVDIVAHPSDEARRLESIQRGGRRAAREVSGGTQLARRHPARALDEIDAAHVGPVHPDVQRHGLVEQVLVGLPAADGLDAVPFQVLEGPALGQRPACSGRMS